MPIPMNCPHCGQEVLVNIGKLLSSRHTGCTAKQIAARRANAAKAAYAKKGMRFVRKPSIIPPDSIE